MSSPPAMGDSREDPVPRPPEIPTDPMEFLSRCWSLSALELAKAVSVSAHVVGRAAAPIPEEDEDANAIAIATAVGNPFSFASSVASQMVMDRILFSHSLQEVYPTLTSGRLSHSSGPLNGSLTNSPPVSPPHDEDPKYYRSNKAGKPRYRGGNKTVGRWLKDRKEKKKEEVRVHNAQLHAAVSVAGVAAAVAAIAAATAVASASRKDDAAVKTDAAVASAATLVAAQCVEAAEAIGVEREHLASVVQSAVNVRTPGDIITLTAAAATAALRATTTLNSRVPKDVWNIAAVIPVDKGVIGSLDSEDRRHSHEGKNCGIEMAAEENFLGFCGQEFLARGTELLKRTRKGDLHWKIVSVYINRTGQVMLKMKSKHVAGTITKKKKYVITEVCKNIDAWPGRHLLEGGDQRRYFGLKTMEQRVIEFECWSEEYEAWTQGAAYLLGIAAQRGDE